ncbi:hypothetical protein G6652_09320 [Polynucleobacter paneuropaeus]|nr:hypothetical protein [Polynucleobacter paneuropaeus]MBT8617424.1 hypothetical protein [Polynucleobacter paneuropaeus]MBT8619306.1 hypothetical protein [Polynucleobacter paneuropaeus]MBT8621190.1 hypothetical protein [Polynucleobacter paneuropaeus]MBT8626721.1 hypothetical protein [Polynucleobacter paneuropaeus]
MSTAPPLDKPASPTGRMTFIELPANQIVLDPLIIRKTMQALKEGKSSVGLIQDDRKQIDLRINPDVAFNKLQIDPPIVTPINKECTCYSLIAKYWQIDLIGLLIKINPYEKLNCLVQAKTSAEALANTYADAQFSGRLALSNMLSQQWNTALLHDCFEQRPSDAQFAQFIGVTTKAFQDMRAAQNRSKAKAHE